jgi:hypothetical protein
MVDSDSITTRDLRATFATLAGATDDVRAVQEALGHTSLRMTQIYLHSTRARMLKTAEVASAVLDSARGRTPTTSGGASGKDNGPSEVTFEGAVNSGRGDRIRTYDPLLPKRVEEMASEIIRHPKGLARLTELHRELCEVNGGRTPTPDPQVDS